MSKGFVYILTNPAMPGIVKIGRTERDPERRAVELFQTGVPQPFVVSHSVYSFDCMDLERSVHEALAQERVHQGREFFALDIKQAIGAVDDCAKCQVMEFVEDFAPGMTLVDEGFEIDEAAAGMLATDIGAHPFEVVAAYAELTADEIAPAFARYKERVARRVAKAGGLQ